MIYDIYVLQLGFQPVAVVGRLVQKRKQTAQKGKQYTQQYKNTEYTNRKQKTNKNICN